MIKIFIADDHRIMREGLKQIIAEIPDIDVVGEASNGQETIEKLQHSTKCDMVLLDISMPGRDGLDILKQIKVEMPELPVLILSESTIKFLIKPMSNDD